jgi:hypothetical protein
MCFETDVSPANFFLAIEYTNRMGGGLLQLVAYGAQDVYLTGDPQITFFKVVYRRHTNFALESIEQTFNGSADFGKRVTCQISRNGDLIHRVYLQVTLPAQGAGVKYADFVGLALMNYVELEIGGQSIDKHYPDWLYIWNELTLPQSKKLGYRKMVGANPDFTNAYNTAGTLYVPLEFWFCRNPGLALPLIALQYHEVKINIQFEALANLVKVGTGTTAITSASLWVDYVFLDTDERRRFAQLSHEYLIEQLQFTGAETIAASANRIKLNFNHPVKELVWVLQRSTLTSNYWFNYASADGFDTAATEVNPDSEWTGANTMTACKLQLNGHDRFTQRDGAYFNLVQPYQHHTNIPNNPGINVYSFALQPQEHQPSGTLNMSRIDTAVLSFTSSYAGTIKTFAVNYNVLRVMSGMGGLAYST